MLVFSLGQAETSRRNDLGAYVRQLRDYKLKASGRIPEKVSANVRSLAAAPR